ncbi:MAG TPA: glycosyltransferase [Pseudogracilibacillus sp.]|nr:glycosyltransferase [Pseudogracilibacillus sp.]
MIKITHIITGLNIGGAEKMLYKLLQNMNEKNYKIEVIVLQDKGFYGPKIEELGIKVHEIKMKNIPRVKDIMKIRKLIKNADVVQSWMYHADLINYLATRFLKKKVIWGIRRTNLNKKENKKSTLLIAKLNALLSRRANLVISCSIAAKKTHINFGYSENKVIVIPNGFEMDKIYKDIVARSEIRDEMEIENKQVILSIGRWNIAKDHKNLIHAYKKVENTNTHLVLIGPNITEDNVELIEIIKESKIKNYSLLGPQSNINDYLSAADIYVSSSKSEGFPNVIGEAMACELPCVVTDAGDSEYIVGDVGITVPIENSEELAKGIEEMLSLTNEERKKLGKKSRKRIKDNFDIEVVAKMFEEQYY